MDVFYFIAALLLVAQLRKSVRISFILYPKWRTLLTTGTWIIIGLYIVNIIYFEDAVRYLIGSALLCGLVYYANKEPDFESQRAYLIANIPLAAVGFIASMVLFIKPDFYDRRENYFALAVIAGFVWIFGRWAASKKQSEELRINAQRRAELESLVQERTLELSQQKDELQEVVRELKSAQAQLIQSEKMASLGELTAGIAHEIQNPLNFVNNFSEVSAELVDEMEDELDKGDVQEAKAIAADIKQNLEKIRHHGKRADSIVKGMLEHSRASTGERQPTNINTLADEYFKLSYHGLRAKDKSFNAKLVTRFDENLPPINVVPQDIGRVLLNLFNNAFYTVAQKAKTAGADYSPKVTVTTSAENKSVIIKVRDNGNGIPDAIKEKIMQPFFTTKPTGEGTGLGLSLSYDIVVKVHGGKIEIETQEGDHSIFTVSLPA